MSRRPSFPRARRRRRSSRPPRNVVHRLNKPGVDGRGDAVRRACLAAGAAHEQPERLRFDERWIDFASTPAASAASAQSATPSVVAGSTITIQVVAEDVNGNPTTNYTGPAAVTFTGAGVTLSGTSLTLTGGVEYLAFTDGVATFQATVGAAGTSDAFTITDTAEASIVGTTTVTVVAAPTASQYSVQVLPPAPPAGRTGTTPPSGSTPPSGETCPTGSTPPTGSTRAARLPGAQHSTGPVLGGPAAGVRRARAAADRLNFRRLRRSRARPA